MYCKYCGEVIDDDSIVCPKCGNQVGQAKNSYAQGVGVTKSGKSKIAAGLLGIFVGGLGIHHFYMGKTGKGIFSILFCWTGIPAILGFIKGIIILCESDEAFERSLNS